MTRTWIPVNIEILKILFQMLESEWGGGFQAQAAVYPCWCW